MRRNFVLCILGLHSFIAVPQSRFARKIKLQPFIAAAILSALAVSSGAAQPQRLSGHVPKITRRLSPLGRLDANYRMRVAIGLPLRNPEQLTNLLEDIYNPSSPNFRHFLKAGEFAATFGPSQEDYQKVIDFAKSHGLIVKGTHPNRTLLDLEGLVADVEKAFHVHMLVYQHPVEARTFFAPDADPSLDLDTPVLAISGLDNYVKPRPQIHTQIDLANTSPKIRPLGGGGGGGGNGDGGGPFDGYDYRNAYAPGVSQVGTGQSLGLFELFGFNPQDITDYEDENEISPYVTVTPISIDGASTSDNVDYLDDCGYFDYAFEATGDIEMAISMAPGLSSVRVYIGPTPQDEPPLGTNYIQDATTTAQINDVFNGMATDTNLCEQLSCSYGMDINLSTVQIFQQFAAQGQSLFVAVGDFGAFSSAIDEPADDPYATMVGGTTLTTNSAAEWASETTWTGPAGTDICGNPVPPQASAGGISTVYSIPSWQQGISMTANQGSTTMRNSPDVSLVANNINVVWGNTLLGSSLDWTVTGTSLATPLWAGFIALVNQQAAANSRPPIGFPNPALYAIGKSTNYSSCFHDITSGSNTNSSSPTKYHATTGYDLCTGWGTIIGGNLMRALLSPPLDNLRIASSLGFTSQGRSGGPFSVTSQTYTLSNAGATPLTWSLVNTSSWLTVSSAGGALNAGSSSNVTVSLNAKANSFLIAHANGNVAFNNLTAGTIQNRQFDLYVGNGGFETGDFTNWTLVGDTILNFALADDDLDIAGEDALPGEPDELFVHSGIYGAYLGQWPYNGEPGNGTLSQTVPTTAGQPLLVSFWVTSIPDENDDPPTNGFAVSWNGSTLFMQTNLLTDSTWTNMQYIVSSSGTSGTLQFEFNNTPGAFGLDDVTVEPLPAPVLNSTVISNGNIAFSWSAIPNLSYQIQTTTNLGNSNWSDVGSPILATNNAVSVSEPVGNAPGRFYRVVINVVPF